MSKQWQQGAVKGKPGLDRLATPGKVRARYRDASGKQWSKVFSDPGAIAKAEHWRREALSSVGNGTHVTAADGKALFAAFAHERAGVWRKHRDTTRAQVDSHLRNHVLPYLGSKQVGAITYADVEAWVAHRSEVLAPATLRVVFAWLRRIFADAVRQQLIRVSPCDGIELPRVPQADVEAIPLEAVQSLADAMPPRLRVTVHVAAWSGLRQGEILGLRRHRLDLLGQRDAQGRRRPPSIYVAEQLQTLAGGPRLVPPKTEKSKRRVPIPGVLVEELAAHLAQFPAEPDGLLFTTQKCTPVPRSRFGDAWRKAVDTAGLPKGTHFHALRHTYATVLIEGGQSVTAVSRRLGHASPTETLATYSHLFPDNDESTVDLLNAVHGRLVSLDVSRRSV